MEPLRGWGWTALQQMRIWDGVTQLVSEEKGLVAVEKKAVLTYSILSASWMLSKMAHSHSCWQGAQEDCQPGVLILFHVVSPCSLHFTEHSDWIKERSIPRVGKELWGSDSLASEVIQDCFCHIPLVKASTAPTRGERSGPQHSIGRTAKNL